MLVRPVSKEKGPSVAAHQPRRQEPGEDLPGDRRAGVRPAAVSDIASLVGEDNVHDGIHGRRGQCWRHKGAGGRPRTVGQRVCEHICLIARTPQRAGNIDASSARSMARLAGRMVEQYVAPAVSRAQAADG